MDIVLIAGLWLPSTVWTDVATELERLGHRAVPVALPGVDDGAATATLDDQLDAVLAVVDTAERPLVVGHSAASTLAWLTADRRHGALAGVVMIGGFPNSDGSSYADFFEIVDGVMAFPGWEPFDGPDSDDLDAAARSGIEAIAVAVPAGVAQATVTLGDDGRFAVPVVLVCPEYTPEQAREWIDAGEISELERATRVSMVDIDSGHWPMISRPAELAGILHEIAEEVHGPGRHHARPDHGDTRRARGADVMSTSAGTDDAVIEWLLDGDPAIRWQVMRDLLDASADQVAAERALVAQQGWGARLLALEDPDGLWDGGACFPGAYRGDEDGQPWTATMHTLQTLLLLGLDPDSATARRSIALVAENGRWEHDGQRFFDGEVEPCINGRTVETGAYFGVDVAPIVDRLLGERLDDGGWNCEAENGSVRTSFDTTINVLDGLLQFERADGASDEVAAARRHGEEYLLERHLFRRKSTGEVAQDRYLDFVFPYYWRYDVLRALDYFRAADASPDPRMAEAIDLVRTKRQADGRWLLDGKHLGRVHFDLESVGEPSRWNTLRALRVLRWWDR